MKLFVWKDPYRVSYGASILYIVAENEEAARQQAREAVIAEFGYTDNPPKIHCADKLKAPDRVIELTPDKPAYAEIYEWSE